ncbi:hypothetical protein BDY24DRAFT_388132 [Mrakia frigida]|uniref:uncharacterized protein n=1 Tax=Mrakia frigida TaxID=29902 RepID=UPI003FCC24C0
MTLRTAPMVESSGELSCDGVEGSTGRIHRVGHVGSVVSERSTVGSIRRCSSSC